MFLNKEKKDVKFTDLIFKMNKNAQDDIKKFGEDAVINGTIGALTDDNGKLITFDAIESLFCSLEREKISAYAPFRGVDSFIDAAKRLCFEEYLPKKEMGATVVAGGVAGIRHAIDNYTEVEDEVITSDWYWGPYFTIAKEAKRKIRTFNFIKSDRFDLEAFKETVDDLIEKQGRAFLLINTPAHNPTGYTISSEEWEEIISFLNKKEVPITLFLDVAYIEFASFDAKKELFSVIDRLKEHIMVLVNYSISKGFAKYGFRNAVVFAFHEKKEEVEQFENAFIISNLASYATAPATGQYLISALTQNDRLLKEYKKEKNEWYNVLKRRAEMFLSIVPKEKVMPYKDGFFISLKSDVPLQFAEKLKKEHIYLVPMQKGLRIAICSISEEKLRRLAEKVR